MKERNPLFDYLKGFAIILVVLGHSIQTHLGEKADDNLVFKVIYSFHMPLFMFVSGYISFENRDKSVSRFFKKIRALVLPFLTWFIISCCISYAHYLKDGGSSPDFSLMTINLFKWPENGLWFLWILFLNHFLLFLARQINPEKEGVYLFLFWIILNSFAMIFNTDQWGIGLLRWHLFFFLTGYCMNKHKQYEKFYSVAGKIACLIFPVIVLTWNTNNIPDFYETLNVNDGIKNVIGLFYNNLVAVSGVLAVYTLFKWIVRFKLFFQKYFIDLGMLTLEIYCCHAYFLNLIPTEKVMPVYLQILISFILGLSVSLLFQSFVKRIPILPLFLYGK